MANKDDWGLVICGWVCFAFFAIITVELGIFALMSVHENNQYTHTECAYLNCTMINYPKLQCVVQSQQNEIYTYYTGCPANIILQNCLDFFANSTFTCYTKDGVVLDKLPRSKATLYATLVVVVPALISLAVAVISCTWIRCKKGKASHKQYVKLQEI